MSVSMPVATISILVGMCTALFMPVLPKSSLIFFALLLSFTMLKIKSSQFIPICGFALLGFSILVLRANQHLNHQLPTNLEGQTLVVIGTISSVVENYKNPNSKIFLNVSQVNNNLHGWVLPAKIQLSWQGTDKLHPGDTWQLQVKIKCPRNFANPGSFDLERHSFMHKISGIGYVLNSPHNKKLDTNAFYAPGNYCRQYLYTFMQQHLYGEEFMEILAALSLGISNIDKDHCAVFQKTGTNHLLAISGLHIGILASFIMLLIKAIWYVCHIKRFNRLQISSTITMLTCILYAYLVGLGIATQRAIIMLIAFLSGMIFKRYITAWQSYCMALLIILLCEPFAILSYGFWFSFGAVGLLLYGINRREKPVNIGAKLLRWSKPQLVLSLGLIPLSFFCFGKLSLISPLANLLIIPWVSLLVLPICLLGLLILPIYSDLGICLFKLANKSLSCVWGILEYLAQIPIYNWEVAPQYFLSLAIIAFCGCLWLLAPTGYPGRVLGVCGLLPLLFMPTRLVKPGVAEFTLLDVGQGLACVIRTAKHVLIYDTGARLTPDFDLGKQVVVPYLHYIGVRSIDIVVLSHGDNDHIGGFASIADEFKIEQIIGSDEYMLDRKIDLCIAGQNWEWDGVKFAILHPEPNTTYKKRNDGSCVLLIEAKNHKILLTGDIEKNSEKQLIKAFGDKLQADVLLVPHHGSKTSSSLEFIQTVKPKYALIPAGYKNRYQHPRDEILQRYFAHNIPTLNTISSGALSISLGESLSPSAHRTTHKRFWSVH